MNRRDLLAAAVGTLSLQRMPSVSRRPWAKRADELFETEGVYCDYVAWREWFEREMSSDGFENPLEAYTPDEVHLYTLMCDLCDRSEP